MAGLDRTAALYGSGRGCASGRVSGDDDAPQETVKEHGCIVEPSPAPPETTGAVLVEAAKPARKARSELPTDIEPASWCKPFARPYGAQVRGASCPSY